MLYYFTCQFSSSNSNIFEIKIQVPTHLNTRGNKIPLQKVRLGKFWRFSYIVVLLFFYSSPGGFPIYFTQISIGLVYSWANFFF